MLRVILVLAVLLGVQCAGPVGAAEPGCERVASWVAMMKARSQAQLDAARATALFSYEGSVIYAVRRFEMSRSNAARAKALLDVMPSTEEEDRQIGSLGDSSQCNSETVAEMFLLGKMSDLLAKRLAEAVLHDTTTLPRYFEYVRRISQTPHGAGAVEMRHVCRSNHAAFVSAVRGLDADSREWFVSHIMKPDNCKVLALPEAE